MNSNISGGFEYFMYLGDEPVKVSVLTMQSTWLQHISSKKAMVWISVKAQMWLMALKGGKKKKKSSFWQLLYASRYLNSKSVKNEKKWN